MKRDLESSFRLLIVHDHVLIRQGLSALFSSSGGVEAIGCGQREAAWMSRRFAPEVVLLHVGLPDEDPFGLGASILGQRRESQVMFLDDALCPKHVRLAVEAGGRGYWTTLASFDHLAEAVHRVADGGLSFCPAAWRYVGETAYGRKVGDSVG